MHWDEREGRERELQQKKEQRNYDCRSSSIKGCLNGMRAMESIISNTHVQGDILVILWSYIRNQSRHVPAINSPPLLVDSLSPTLLIWIERERTKEQKRSKLLRKT